MSLVFLFYINSGVCRKEMRLNGSQGDINKRRKYV